MKKNVRNMQYTADDFRLDPEEVAFLRKLKEEHGRLMEQQRQQWEMEQQQMLTEQALQHRQEELKACALGITNLCL